MRPCRVCAEDSGGDAFAGDVCDDDGEGLAVFDDVEEVSADFAAGHGARGDLGPGERGRADGHEAALNFGGDIHFLAVDALAFLGHGELRVIDQRGGVGGDGAEEVAVDLGEAACFETAVEIEQGRGARFRARLRRDGVCAAGCR